MPDNAITLIGNLVENPVLRITASGVSVCGFRLASTPRRFDRTEQRWVDGSTLYLRISCWRQLAENVAASLSRGDRALVVGRLRQNNYETQDGDRRVSYEIDAEAVAAELTWRPVEVRRTARSSGTPAEGPAAGDPFADATPMSGDPFGADGDGIDGVGFGEEDGVASSATAGSAPPAGEARMSAGEARMSADEARMFADGGRLPADEPRALAGEARTSVGEDSRLESAAAGPGAAAVASGDPGVDDVPVIYAVELARDDPRHVSLHVGSGVGRGPGHEPVDDAETVPRLKALFEDALRSVEPAYPSRDGATSRPPTGTRPGAQTGTASGPGAGAARAQFRVVRSATRAVGERPIGLADVVGERRLRGLGGAIS